MRSIILIGAFLIGAAQADELVEHGCALQVRESGSDEIQSIVLDPEEFNLLSYGPDNEFVSFIPNDGTEVVALACQRSDTIPSTYDYMVLDAGLPLHLADEKRTVALEILNGQYRLRILKGEAFSEIESEKVVEKLNEFQARKRTASK